MDKHEKEKAAVAGVAVFAAGLLIGCLICKCRGSGGGGPPAQGQFTMVANDSTGTTTVALTTESVWNGSGFVNQNIIGPFILQFVEATQWGDILVFLSASPTRPSPSSGTQITTLQAGGDGEADYQLLISELPSQTAGSKFYLWGYDAATGTWSNMITVTIVLPAYSPSLDLGNNIMLAPGDTVIWTGKGSPGDQWEFHINFGDLNEPEQGLGIPSATQSGQFDPGAKGSFIIPMDQIPGSYTAVLYDTTIGGLAYTQFTVT